MTIEVSKPSGMLVVSEIVTKNGEAWFERLKLMGYSKKEAKNIFKEHCKKMGLKIVK